MTYSESAQGLTISKARAIRELKDHGIFQTEDFAQFFEECGDKPEYLASDVLAWLGY
jgi:hypothetical protein